MDKNLQNIPTCNNCHLKHKTMFTTLQLTDFQEFNFEKIFKTYKRAEIIYKEGNKTAGVYCVYFGNLKLYKTGPDSKEQIIRFAKPGDLIGFRSVLSTETACTSAKTLEETKLCFIPSDIFIKLVKNNQNFSMQLIKLSCFELGEANKFILDMAQKNVRERLAEVLLLLKDTFLTDKEGFIKVVLTREEIANIVGTATETIIRLLSDFKHDKIIELKTRKIKLLNLNQLQRISEKYAI